MNIGVLVRAARPPFLILTPVCVALGAASVAADGGSIAWPLFWLVLAGASAAHISVNALNEYADFKSGLDLQTRRTPFSGGSGALPAAPECARQVLVLGLCALAFTVCVGGGLIFLRGAALLPLGVAGVALVALYTPWVNRSPWVCLLAPGLGFGILMVNGTALVLGDGYTGLAAVVALVPFALVNNVLLLNQYPDLDADRNAGRRHVVIAYGTVVAARCYAGFTALAAGTLLAGIAAGWLPALAGVAGLPLLLSVYAWLGADRHGRALGEQPHYLAANVAAAVLTTALLAIALFTS